MDQTLALHVDQVHLVALGLREGADAIFERRWAATAVGLGLDYVVAALVRYPITFAHEEWHMAALREGGLDPIDRWTAASVVGLTDDDLAGFKASDPSGFVRAHEAGIELQIAAARQMSDEGLAYAPEGWSMGRFESGRTFVAPHIQAAEIETFVYLSYCAGTATDREIPTIEAEEGGETERDFTGPDCTGWVRDLVRPDEPYSARGPNASGVGIGRYVANADLTRQERSLLDLQRTLHILDLVNPKLYGFDRIRIGDAAATVALTHWLTPYGYALDLHAGYRLHGPTWFGTVRLGVSAHRVMPSLEAEVWEVRLSDAFAVDGGITAWLQPRDLRFGGDPVPGGAVSAKLRWSATGRLLPWVGVEAKSAGWEVGLASLDPALYVRGGATLALGRPTF